MRRVATLIKKTGTAPVSHDNFMALIWDILGAGNQELADTIHNTTANYRPYVWSVETWPDDKGYTITFASVKEEIAQAFLGGSEKLSISREAISIAGNLFQVDSAIPIRDLRHIPKTVEFASTSPIVTSMKINGKRRYLVYQNDPSLTEIRLTNNLKRRIKAFYGTDTPTFNLKIINTSYPQFTEYKGTRIPGSFLNVRITGDPEAIAMALYGGLGERTGSGFGMIAPC